MSSTIRKRFSRAHRGFSGYFLQEKQIQAQVMLIISRQTATAANITITTMIELIPALLAFYC